MNSDTIGGLVGVSLFLVLPIVIGLAFLIKARAVARSRLRWLTHDNAEPSDAAVTRYRVLGVIFIALPIIVFVMAIAAMMK
ncbi:hypothetical protein [Dictyobacter aurantiacus]|uniref:DUF6199 domain-containing protein n=1 Tax=Dictyobacter aurantiacus TaxID=1936993 RepID=A0A401ZJR9_9CHLR|nr:hypothetical protein [Dictyobacter aurantiacus]GCE07089.1 hypothetical protein KDAU_44180 [Dictyobacter aurantiacus]